MTKRTKKTPQQRQHQQPQGEPTLKGVTKMEKQEPQMTELGGQKQDDRSWSWEKATLARNRALERTKKLEEEERSWRLTSMGRQFLNYQVQLKEKYLKSREGIKPSLTSPYPRVSSGTVKAHVIIEEEKERERRVAQEAYLDEVEHERSETNRAHSRIAEEQEKMRRISEDAYQQELAEQTRKKQKEIVVKAEEEERNRRLTELETKTRDELLKQIQSEQEKMRQQVHPQIIAHGGQTSKQRE